jgi:hypothetical protein
MNNASPTSPDFEWYAVSAWDDLQQGDLLLKCPVLVPTDQLTPTLIGITEDIEDKSPVDVIEFNLVIMSQSCDLANDTVDQVLLCAYSEAPLGNKNLMSDLIKDRRPALHLIEKCELEKHEFPRQIVQFRTIYTLPKDFVVTFADSKGERVRLLPPYREHLSQAFARYFMRVGLPRPLN